MSYDPEPKPEAKPQFTPEQVQQAMQALGRQIARDRKLYLDKAWFRGNSARGRYFRLSPYYEDPGADIFWFAGYDGLTLQDAALLHDAACAAKEGTA